MPIYTNNIPMEQFNNSEKIIPLFAELFRLEAEFLSNFPVAFLVLFLQIREMGAAIGNHLEKPSARVVVFRVFLQMRGKGVNLFREHSNLDLGRPSVLLVSARLFDN